MADAKTKLGETHGLSIYEAACVNSTPSTFKHGHATLSSLLGLPFARRAEKNSANALRDSDYVVDRIKDADAKKIKEHGKKKKNNTMKRTKTKETHEENTKEDTENAMREKAGRTNKATKKK